jgi:putative ABC transport system substrate-binding protein
LTALNRKRVIDFALVHRIPAMYEFSFLVRDGGLIYLTGVDGLFEV